MVFNNNLLLGAAGQGGAASFDPTLIGNSVWFNGTDSRMDSPAFSAQSDPTCFTFATWVQILDFSISPAGQYLWSAERTGNYASIRIDNNNKLVAYSNPASFTSDMIFRDIGWYHIICSYKGSANTVRMFVNGVEISNTRTNSLATNPEPVAFSHTQRIGAYYVGATGGDLYEANSYMAQTVFLDGFSFQDGDITVSDFLDTFTFGTSGSQFIPKKNSDLATLAGTAGANSYVLDFSTASVALSSGVTPTSNAGTFSGSLSNLTDGNFTTEWRSNVDPATNVNNDHVAFDLGSAKNVKAVKITGRASVTGNYKVQFSDNGSDFTDTGTTFSNVSITTTANSGILDLTSDNPGSHRYWKLINISNSSGTSGWGFREIILASAVGNLGTDASGNGNDFTLTNISSANQSTSTPSNVHSKFNPLDHSTAATITLSNGNRTLAMTTANWKHARTSLPFPDESYCEVVLDARSAAGRMYVGLATGSYNVYSTSPPNTTDSAKRCIYSDSGTFYDFSDTSGTSYTSASLTDVLQVYRKGSNFYIGINGTWVNSADPDADTNPISSSIPSENVFLFVGGYSGETYTLRTEAGEWTASNRPASAKAVNTANQTAPEYQGIDYFDATIYEGNGAGQRVGDFVPFTDAYTVTNSVMFEDGDSRSLTLNSSATRTSATVAAFSLWTKRANLGTNQRPLTVQVDGSNYFSIYYNPSDQLDFTINNGGATILQRITTRVFKDTSAWHNIVVIINQGEGTQADRVKVFYDGVQIPNDSTGFGTNTCTLDGSSALNFLDSASAVHDVGGGSSTGFTQTYDGYVSEVAFLDGADSGAKLNGSDFGQVDTSTNRWIPKDISGYSFGNTGYYLEFKVAPGTGNGAGTDTSGESNNFTSNGSWATTDQFADCPSQNFPTFDPSNNGAGTLSEGNTKIVSSTDQRTTYTNMVIPSTGKWYWEVDVTNYVSGGGSYFGVVPSSTPLPTNNPSNGFTDQVVFETFSGNSNFYSSSPNGGTAWCNTPGNNNFVADGDVLQFALDQDAGTFFIGNNNTWYRAGGARDTFANATTVAQSKMPTGIPRRFIYGRGGSFAETYALNFGQQANEFSGSSTTFNAAADGYFVYTPPTDYKALNQDNLDDTASKITAWAWIKNRDSIDSHVLVDRVRGVGVEVHTDGTTTTPETTNTNTVQRFLQRGVQVGNDVQVNTANESYVLWQWLVGDSATTGTTNENGSLDSTVIAADAGHFSVVSWTGNETAGATVGHGLGGTPDFIMAIARAESGENKPVYHTFMTADTDHLKINEANGQGTAGTTIWDESAMSSTLIGLGAAVQSNSNNGMIAYCFRSVPGVCKVGQYSGNGDGTGSDTVDGPYVSCGFKPRWIMFKWVSGGSLSSEGWVIKDTARQTFNPNDDADIYANFTTAENAGATHGADILSDGFKIRGGGGAVNKSGATYLYVAMAEIGGNGTLPPIYGR